MGHRQSRAASVPSQLQYVVDDVANLDGGECDDMGLHGKNSSLLYDTGNSNKNLKESQNNLDSQTLYRYGPTKTGLSSGASRELSSSEGMRDDTSIPMSFETYGVFSPALTPVNEIKDEYTQDHSENKGSQLYRTVKQPKNRIHYVDSPTHRNNVQVQNFDSTTIDITRPSLSQQPLLTTHKQGHKYIDNHNTSNNSTIQYEDENYFYPLNDAGTKTPGQIVNSDVSYDSEKKTVMSETTTRYKKGGGRMDNYVQRHAFYNSYEDTRFTQPTQLKRENLPHPCSLWNQTNDSCTYANENAEVSYLAQQSIKTPGITSDEYQTIKNVNVDQSDCGRHLTQTTPTTLQTMSNTQLNANLFRYNRDDTDENEYSGNKATVNGIVSGKNKRSSLSNIKENDKESAKSDSIDESARTNSRIFKPIFKKMHTFSNIPFINNLSFTHRSSSKAKLNVNQPNTARVDSNGSASYNQTSSGRRFRATRILTPGKQKNNSHTREQSHASSSVDEPTSGRPSISLKTFGSSNLSYEDFVIRTTVGTGTFGRVRLVNFKHENGNIPYALKILKKDYIIKLKQVEHVKSEKRLLSAINHPFIVNLLAAFQDESRLYMLMEYVNGGELFSLLRKEGRLSSEHSKFYASEIILAFQYLHDLNIVYRDLKPENLLIDKTGHIKITDFGFAKLVEDRTWTLCGTPEYLAPEMIQTKGHGKSVDWWALGILIFEMLAGYPPFYDDTPYGIYQKVLACKIEYPDYIKSKARNIISRLLCPDKRERLGCGEGGASDVMRHPWLQSISWTDCYKKKLKAPHIPKINAEDDTSMFDAYPDSTEGLERRITSDEQAIHFDDF